MTRLLALLLLLGLGPAAGPVPSQEAKAAPSPRKAAAPPLQEALAVIVHPATPANDLSFTQLRRLFLGEQQFWPGGTRVVLFVYAPGTPPGDAVLAQLYGMSESEYKRYWIAKTFRDDVATGPKIVSSPEMALRLTARVPGAIALVPVSQVDSTVRVLTIDSLRPGETAYPFGRRGQ